MLNDDLPLLIEEKAGKGHFLGEIFTNHPKTEVLRT